MKTRHIACLISSVALTVALSGCEKPAERDDNESPATHVSPSEPVPQPETIGEPKVESDGDEEP